MSSLSAPTLFVFTALACALVSHIYRRSTSKVNPPGPSIYETYRDWRGLGRGHPGLTQWKALSKMTKKFGSYCYATIYGNNFLVIDDYESAVEIVNGKSEIYSGRPYHSMLGDQGNWKTSTVLVQYGNQWRHHRTMMAQTLAKSQMPEHRDALTSGIRSTLEGLLDHPANFDAQITLGVCATILKTVFGIHIDRADDPIIVANERSIASVPTTGPFGVYLVDFLPFLSYLPSWMPGTGFKKVAAEIAENRRVVIEAAYARSKEENQSGKLYPASMAATAFEEGSASEHDIKYSCGAMFNAGLPTGRATLRAFIWTMMLNPEAQRKVQAEIDRFLGTGKAGELSRLPTNEDRADLPYLEACIKEATRWHVATPLGISHSTSEDSVIGGKYFVPKGTAVMINQWAMSRDERHYPNPDEFIPERHMGDSPALDPFKWIFGFGRRVCPGQFFSDEMVFTLCASMAACFNIERPKDADGKPRIDEIPDAHSGPRQSFDAHFEPRFPSSAELIRAL